MTTEKFWLEQRSLRDLGDGTNWCPNGSYGTGAMQHNKKKKEMKKEHNMVLPLPLGSDGGLREYVLTASGFSRKEIWQEKKKKKTHSFRCAVLP